MIIPEISGRRRETSDAYVYRLIFDTDYYSTLLYDMPSKDVAWPLIDFHADSRLSVWPAPPVVMAGPARSMPDVWWLSQARLPAMTSEVVASLEPFISMCGELLPLQTTVGPALYALNVLNVVDALVRAGAGPDGLILRPAFLKHRLGEPSVFMIPQLIGTFFCVVWNDFGASFKQSVQHQGLTGVKFQAVWSSIGGGRDINLLEG